MENLAIIAIVVVACLIVWKVSKTVIHMVIGFIILLGIAVGVWYVYSVGLSELSDSGYFAIFIKGVGILLSRLKEIVL